MSVNGFYYMNHCIQNRFRSGKYFKTTTKITIFYQIIDGFSLEILVSHQLIFELDFIV